MKCRFGLLFCLLVLYIFPADASGSEKVSGDRKLEIVFCMDLSGSTNGLINDLRDNLWHIINQAKLLTPKPELRIGVVGFSRPSFKKENSYVKVLCDLTTDFDFLAAELSKIRPSIEKGDQYIGAALRKGVLDISWSEEEDAKKIIYIVGNGMVADPSGEYIKSCELAVKRNITINSIYVVSNYKAKEILGWHKIATMGRGISSEMTVGFREKINDETVATKEFFNAARDFNLTCMFYSVNGMTKYMEYRKADSIAYAGGNASFFERVYYKSMNLITGGMSWDVVNYYTRTGLLPAYSDTLLFPDSLKNKSNEYIYDLVKTLKSDRQRSVSRMNTMLINDYPLKMHDRYANGELKDDNNLFSRCVINMLLKQWKE
ncbi:MAG: vWA domain-containing protein [Bacteroidota bacterium]